MDRFNTYEDYSASGHKMLMPVFFAILSLGAYAFILFKGNVLGSTSNIFIGLLGVIIVYALTFIDVRIGMALMLVATGISEEITIGGYENFRYEDFIIPVIFLAWLIRIADRKTQFEETSLKTPVLLLILVTALSSIKGIAIGTTQPLITFFHFGKMLEYFIIFVIFMNNMKSEREAKGFIIILIIASLVVGGLGFYEYQRYGTSAQFRLAGPKGEGSNILGGYYMFHLSLLAGVIATSKTNRLRLFLIAIFALNFVPLLLTLSRTSYLALLFSLLIIGLKKKKFLLILLIILIIAPFFASANIIERASTVINIFKGEMPSSLQARLYGIKQFSRNIVRYPLLGMGEGAIPLSAVDNEYVKRAIDTGIIGLILFFWMILRMFKIGLNAHNLTKEDDSILSGFSLGFVAGLAGLLVHGLGATSFTTIRTMEPLMAVAGIVVGINNNFPAWIKMKKLTAESKFEKKLGYFPMPHNSVNEKKRRIPLP